MTHNSRHDHTGKQHKQSVFVGLKSPLVPCALLAVGVFFAGKALLSPDLEWRLLAMAGLAFALSPFRLEARTRGSSESIPLPLWHSALFAGSVVLGPFAAALPGAFYGAARVILGPRSAKPLASTILATIKPMAACAVTSLAYVLAGGSVLRPQAVDSFVPMLAAGTIYVAANVALTAISGPRAASAAPGRRTPLVLVGWSLCLLAGYMMAVLYAVAPTYVLLGPCIAAGVAGYALREPKVVEEIAAYEEPEAAVETPVETAQAADVPQESAESEAASSFVDHATGLANERYLAMFLRTELGRAARQGRPLSVAVFDLDGARKLSPKAMEASLATLGARLKDSVREYDLVVRLSSHRLLVVLPEASATEAYEVAIRLHQSATSAAADAKAISASVGLATFPEHGATHQELINASHRALNHGRLLGPNRVHIPHKLAKTG